jgi:glutamate synthase domain-containing protein 1
MKILLFTLVLSFPVLAQTPSFTHNRFTENGKTFSQDGTAIVADCIAKIGPGEAASDSGYMQTMLCAGYIEGVADLLSDGKVCIPPTTEGKELVDVFLKYAAKHEDMLHGPASRIVASAMQSAYACTTH